MPLTYAFTAFGGPETERFLELPVPVPGPGQVRVRVRAAATAYDALVQLALPAGATVLITGAGGGVGVAAVQIARRCDLCVVGSASPAKKDFVESLGAVPVEYGEGLVDRIHAAVPAGVDGVLDLIGGADLEAVAELVADRGRLVSATDRVNVARLGGEPVRRARNRAVLETLVAWTADRTLRPYVTAVFPLVRAAEALRRVEHGHVRGKVVIAVAG